MKKMTANDGSIVVSYNIKTKEGNDVAFCYVTESGMPEVISAILKRYPAYFELLNGNQLWVKETVDGNISIGVLKDVVNMDETGSSILLNCEDKMVIEGVDDLLDPDSLKDLA